MFHIIVTQDAAYARYVCDNCDGTIGAIAPGWIDPNKPGHVICATCLGSTLPKAEVRSRNSELVRLRDEVQVEWRARGSHPLVTMVIDWRAPATPVANRRWTPRGRFEECNLHAVPCPTYYEDSHEKPHPGYGWDWCCYYCCEVCKDVCKDPVTGQKRKS